MMIGQAARGITRLTLQPRHAFSMLNDYFTQKNVKKQEAEFKREMEYLANKPSFTLMDYKQRVIDELNKLKSRTISPTQSLGPNSTKTPKNKKKNCKWKRKY